MMDLTEKVLKTLADYEKAASPSPWQMDGEDQRDADCVHYVMYANGKAIFDTANSDDCCVLDESDEDGPHYREDTGWRNFLFIQGIRNYAKDILQLALKAEHLQRTKEQDDEMAMQTLRERDDAEQSLSQAYFLVLGRSPEWTSAWRHQECLDEIKDACTILRSERQRLEDENAVLLEHWRWEKQAKESLLAACKNAASLLLKLGGKNHDPEYSEMLAAIAKAEK
jgi:hypothetical protein